MKKKVLFSLTMVVLAAVLVLNSCTKVQAQSFRQVHWEYRMIETANYHNDSGTVANLNSLGSEGWELISTATVESARGTQSFVFYFKRQLP